MTKQSLLENISLSVHQWNQCSHKHQLLVSLLEAIIDPPLRLVRTCACLYMLDTRSLHLHQCNMDKLRWLYCCTKNTRIQSPYCETEPGFLSRGHLGFLESLITIFQLKSQNHRRNRF